ncbi:MAG: flagellar basal body rod protein FlgC [Proteobacteria bacterium]|nr:flagellar basal body rod protein FlgC [Pseudomonadota bacterium]NOG58919.1 flagellar basal body rod protein FlgC [Pseudomonadota bacterium]
MSLLNVFEIAGSAMSAQTVRMNVTASNMANLDAVSSSDGETYRARHPVFETVYSDSMKSGLSNGVRVAGIIESQSPLRKEYLPQHPKADEDGYIFYPNVNSIQEMTNMISATRTFQNNVEIINASKQMLLRTLSIGQ